MPATREVPPGRGPAWKHNPRRVAASPSSDAAADECAMGSEAVSRSISLSPEGSCSAGLVTTADDKRDQLGNALALTRGKGAVVWRGLYTREVS